jgi:hypothetical protein
MIPDYFPLAFTDSNVIRERIAEAERKMYAFAMGWGSLYPDEQLTTAFHEAGHALFGEGLGSPVAAVTCQECLIPSRDFLCAGACEHDADISFCALFRYIRTLAAHYVEWHVTGKSYQREVRVEGCGDCEDLKALEAEHTPGGELLQPYRDKIGQITEGFRNKSWSQIQRTAIQLYGHGTLDGDQVREILKEDMFYEINPLLAFAERCRNFSGLVL